MGPVDSASWRDDASRHFRWEAFDLVAAGHHELGVVAAQVHLEAQLRFALRRALRDADDAVAELALASVARPTRAPAREVLSSVLGVDLDGTELGGPLDAHFERVANVLENAGRVTRDDALASLEAIDALWAEIARAGSAQGPATVPGVEQPQRP